MENGLSLFNAALTLLGVLLLAYWCCRALGKRWGTASGVSSGNLRIIEHIQVGQDRRIILLKAGEKTFLVGVSQAGIQLLAEVEGDFEAVGPAGQESAGWPSFQELMEKYRKDSRKKDGVDR